MIPSRSGTSATFTGMLRLVLAFILSAKNFPTSGNPDAFSEVYIAVNSSKANPPLVGIIFIGLGIIFSIARSVFGKFKTRFFFSASQDRKATNAQQIIRLLISIFIVCIFLSYASLQACLV